MAQRYLLEMSDELAEKFSRFLFSTEEALPGDYAGLVEVTVCDACSCVITDSANHFEEVHSA